MRRVALSCLLLTLVAGTVVAGEPITIGEVITIESKILGEERTILVSTPPEYARSSERYPVLYMTDGYAQLTHTRGTADFLVRNGLMPQVIIVAVTNTDRTRDLSPTRASITEDDGTVREFPTSGGASAFLDFFEQELFSHIDSHYRTLPLRMFAGHSFGGLFALNAFFTRPAMFGAVLAVSPSLRWDNELPIRQAESFSAERKKLNATLVVTMADEEEGDPRPNRLDRLEAVLESAGADGFEWLVLRMPEETHGTVVLRSHYWGLRKVFDGWQLPVDPDTGAFGGTVADLERHFAGLSSRFGFTIDPPEQVVNQAGYQVLGRDDVDGAISIFRFNVDLYPDSANVYDSLGEALERKGQLKEALASYTRAVDHAIELEDERLEIFTANRDRARKQVEEAERE